MSMGDIYSVGIVTLILNAIVAFMLNVAVVFLVGSPKQSRSALFFRLTDALLHNRLARLPRLSLPCPVSLRTSSSSLPPSLFSKTPLPSSNTSDTRSHWVVFATTSSAQRRFNPPLSTRDCSWVPCARTTPHEQRAPLACWSLAASSLARTCFGPASTCPRLSRRPPLKFARVVIEISSGDFWRPGELGPFCGNKGI